MTTRSIALALASGLATFLLVGIGITTVAQHWVGFAMLLALPVGATAGAVSTALVTAGLTGEVPARQRRAAGAFAGLSIGFLVGLLAASQLLSRDVNSSLVAGGITAILLGAWLSVRVGPASEMES